MGFFYWKEDAKAFLTELYRADDAGSFAVLAKKLNERFGTDYTRDAIIGVSKRMGLAGKPPASSGNRLVPKVKESAALRCAEVTPLNIPFSDLGERECRYPYGDGPYLFCGHPAQADSSYCPAHHRLCWMKPISRRSMGVAA